LDLPIRRWRARLYVYAPCLDSKENSWRLTHHWGNQSEREISHGIHFAATLERRIANNFVAACFIAVSLNQPGRKWQSAGTVSYGADINAKPGDL